MTDERSMDTHEDVAAATISMLTQLILPLIDYPEHCSVDLVQRGDSATFVVQVAPHDMEKFVGRNLRTGRSLQVIAGAVGMRSQKRFSLTFRENTEAGRSRSGPISQATGT
jgi:predicted RNA-binding protein YlqC (UPF0109 family)